MKIIGKNITLSNAEQEWLGHMQNMFGITEQQALEEIISYKREQAFGYEKSGQYELARLLLQEIDEWDDNREQEYQQRVSKDVKIFLPPSHHK